MACSSCGKRQAAAANARLANIPASVPHTRLAREKAPLPEPDPIIEEQPAVEHRQVPRASPENRMYCVDEECFESFADARRVAADAGGLRVVAKPA